MNIIQDIKIENGKVYVKRLKLDSYNDRDGRHFYGFQWHSVEQRDMQPQWEKIADIEAHKESNK